MPSGNLPLLFGLSLQQMFYCCAQGGCKVSCRTRVHSKLRARALGAQCRQDGAPFTTRKRLAQMIAYYEGRFPGISGSQSWHTPVVLVLAAHQDCRNSWPGAKASVASCQGATELRSLLNYRVVASSNCKRVYRNAEPLQSSGRCADPRTPSACSRCLAALRCARAACASLRLHDLRPEIDHSSETHFRLQPARQMLSQPSASPGNAAMRYGQNTTDNM